RRTRRELRRARTGEREDEVESVEQRAGEAIAIAVELHGRARAARARIAAAAARTEVHGRDELKPRGEHGAAADARDGDGAVLERLAKRLEEHARELGQLVEEQDAAVCKRHLTRAWVRSAADHRRRGRPVMRRTERRRADEAAAGPEEPCDRVDARHLE